ncbi:hypothetical protein K8R78_03840 [bacterium]|nr:hypothetical protein [bacterium]
MKSFGLLTVALILTGLLLLTGCGSGISDEAYVEIILEKTSYMLDDGLTAEVALEKAAANHQVEVDDVLDFEQGLANDPERLANIAERIMEESTEMREAFISYYSQALPEAEVAEDVKVVVPTGQPAAEVSEGEELTDEDAEVVESTEEVIIDAVVEEPTAETVEGE